MFRRRGNTGGGGLGVMLLALQLFNVGFNNIPVVTLSTILFQSGVFLGLFRKQIPGIRGSCISLANILYYKEWRRLVLAAVVHSSDMHLYFNMISFLWKGKTLEPKLGSKYFAYLLIVFTILTNLVLLGLNYFAHEFLQWPGYFNQCAVGFSGVVFALKVLSTYQMPPGVQYVMFFPVHSRLACWVELVAIQLMVPNASFTGHLAGILVGMAYVKGPLRSVMDFIFKMLSGDLLSRRYYQYNFVEPSGYRPRQEGATNRSFFSNSSGTSGSHSQPYTGSGSSASTARDWSRFTAGYSEEEQLRAATQASLQQAQPLSPSAPPLHPHGSHNDPRAQGSEGSVYPDLEELRRRRAQRYS